MTISKAEAIINEAAMNLPEGIKFPASITIIEFRNSPVAGKAYGINKILINADLAEQYPEQLRETVLHELAHCLVHLNQPRRCKPHGPEWQDMMYVLGTVPKTCHRMEQPELIRKRQRRHSAHCNCKIHSITTTRYMKIAMGENIYTCRKCKGQLILGEPT